MYLKFQTIVNCYQFLNKVLQIIKGRSDVSWGRPLEFEKRLQEFFKFFKYPRSVKSIKKIRKIC